MCDAQPVRRHELKRVPKVSLRERDGPHATSSPLTAPWTAQQVVDAFPWDEAPRYLLRDHNRIYDEVFRRRMWHMGIEEMLIAPPGSVVEPLR